MPLLDSLLGAWYGVNGGLWSGASGLQTTGSSNTTITGWLTPASQTVTSNNYIWTQQSGQSYGSRIDWYGQQGQRSDHASAQQAAYAREQEVYAQRHAEAQRQHIQVQSRAEKLLRSCLTQEQIRQLDAEGFFVVESRVNRKRYVISRYRAANVYRLGKPPVRLCAHPGGALPGPDNMLAQKFMLETDPVAFERIANVHSVESEWATRLERMAA